MQRVLERLVARTIPVVVYLMVASLATGQTSTIAGVTVNGPIPVSADNYPFLAAGHVLEPMDLAVMGYAEDEFLLSGTANVYDWATDGALQVKTANAPYTTRVLVRHPADPARFSGTVIVEVMHAPRGQDFALMWGWAHDYFVEHGDAWVGLTMDPVAAASLRKFNAARYASISFANPNPAERCVATGGRGDQAPVPSDAEEGLRWDMMSQLGAVLKGTATNRPLRGFNVERVYLTSQDPAAVTYVSAVHPHAKLANGNPIYDGFLLKSGGRPVRIRRCAAPPDVADPRSIVRNAGVPVINVLQEGDVLGSIGTRRPDSDEARDRFRLFEVAGTAHFDPYPFRTGHPSMKDAVATGTGFATRQIPVALDPYTLAVPFSEAGRCTQPLTDQPLLNDVFHAAFLNLDAWARKGIVPPKAARIEVVGDGAAARIARDQYGNAIGGLRTPFVDVPTTTYLTGLGGKPGCGANFGSEMPFDWARLEAVYGSYKNYVAKMGAAVDRAVRDRWLTASDGRKIKAGLAHVAAPASE